MHRTLPTVSALLLAAAFFLAQLQPCRAAFDVDFVTGTWDHSGFGGPPSSTGWSSTVTGGETDPGDGLHTTVTYGTVGTATPTPDNLTIFGSAFFLFNDNDTDEGNDPVLTNYAHLTVEFDSAVTFSQFQMTDIDSSDPTTPTWRDAIGVEAWTGAPGSIGTGLQPTDWGLDGATRLVIDSTTFNIPVAIASADGNFATTDVRNAIDVSWSTGVSSVRIYYFDQEEFENEVGDHGVGFINAISGAVAVPEPSGVFLLGAAALGAVLRRGRRRA